MRPSRGRPLNLAGDAVRSSDAVPTDQPGGYQVAPLHRKYILPDMRAQQINARDKVIIGLEGAYSLQNFRGMIVSAGYGQLLNGQPNYGTDSGAFGERLGAAGHSWHGAGRIHRLGLCAAAA